MSDEQIRKMLFELKKEIMGIQYPFVIYDPFLKSNHQIHTGAAKMRDGVMKVIGKYINKDYDRPK